MKRIALLGIVALGVAFAQTARAADYPVFAAPVYQAPVVVAPTWTGLYLGVNAGWGWVTSDEGKMRFVGPAAPLDVRPTLVEVSSQVFGGQLGYNLQTGNWVWGIEVDVDGANMRTNRTVTIPAGVFTPFPGGTAFLNIRQNWVADLHGKIGYTWGPGMIYANFGIAWTGLEITGGATLFGATPVVGSCRGTVMGVGYEWMIAPNWATRFEYMFYNHTELDHVPGSIDDAQLGHRQAPRLDRTHRPRLQVRLGRTGRDALLNDPFEAASVGLRPRGCSRGLLLPARRHKKAGPPTVFDLHHDYQKFNFLRLRYELTKVVAPRPHPFGIVRPPAIP